MVDTPFGCLLFKNGRFFFPLQEPKDITREALLPNPRNLLSERLELRLECTVQEKEHVLLAQSDDNLTVESKSLNNHGVFPRILCYSPFNNFFLLTSR